MCNSKKRKRSYEVRNRTGARGPKIPMQGVVTDKPELVCTKAAHAFLGVGKARVRRVLAGEADGRRRGNRLPNSHPVYAPS